MLLWRSWSEDRQAPCRGAYRAPAGQPAALPFPPQALWHVFANVLCDLCHAHSLLKPCLDCQSVIECKMFFAHVILQSEDRADMIALHSWPLSAAAGRSSKSCPQGTHRKPFSAVYGRTAELLKETELNIEDISFGLGYQNTSKFSATFREITGQSPTSYRRSLHNGHPEF